MFLTEADGLCVWVPVESEQFALVTMAAHGITVQPGSRCAVSVPPHIRIATTRLSDHFDEVASVLALIHTDRPKVQLHEGYFEA